MRNYHLDHPKREKKRLIVTLVEFICIFTNSVLWTCPAQGSQVFDLFQTHHVLWKSKSSCVFYCSLKMLTTIMNFRLLTHHPYYVNVLVIGRKSGGNGHCLKLAGPAGPPPIFIEIISQLLMSFALPGRGRKYPLWKKLHYHVFSTYTNTHWARNIETLL